MATENPTYEHFEFLQETHSKHLNCKICFQLMLDPIRLHRCGHTICKECAEKKNVKKCPLCLESIKTKQKDILASRLVGELGVKCLHQGCPWKGSLMQFRSFHREGCKLKEGGMDQWLKRLEESINVSRKPEKTQVLPPLEKPLQENQQHKQSDQDNEKQPIKFHDHEKQSQKNHQSDENKEQKYITCQKLEKSSTRNSSNSTKKASSRKGLRSTERKSRIEENPVQNMVVSKNFRTDLQQN